MAKLQVNKKSKKFYQISNESGDFTAIATGQPGKALTQIDLASLKRNSTLIKIDNELNISTIELESTTEIDKEYLFLYPIMELEEFSKTWIPEKKEIHQILKLYIYANENDIELPRFSLTSLFQTKNGEIIILPQKLLFAILNKEPKDEWWQTVRFNHPDRSGEVSQSYTIAVLSYLSTVKHFPFNSTEENSIRNEIRRKKIFIPSSETELTRLLDLTLDSYKETPDLKSWLKLFKSTEEWSLDYNNQILKAQQKEDKRVRRIENIRQKSGRLFLTAALGIVALFISITILAKVLEVPLSRGMEQIDVLELYYESIGSLEIYTAEQLVIKDGKKHLDPFQNMLVISKIARSHNDTGGIQVTPEEWLQNTELPLLSTAKVYGIMGLHIEENDNNSFIVEYFQFISDGQLADQVTETGFIPPSIYHIVEKVTLSSKGSDDKLSWFISDVQNIEKEFIDFQSFLLY